MITFLVMHNEFPDTVQFLERWHISSNKQE